jgi:hypothetical protein
VRVRLALQLRVPFLYTSVAYATVQVNALQGLCEHKASTCASLRVVWLRSKIYDSPDMPDAEATFAITEAHGIADID